MPRSLRSHENARFDPSLKGMTSPFLSCTSAHRNTVTQFSGLVSPYRWMVLSWDVVELCLTVISSLICPVVLTGAQAHRSRFPIHLALGTLEQFAAGGHSKWSRNVWSWMELCSLGHGWHWSSKSNNGKSKEISLEIPHARRFSWAIHV